MNYVINEASAGFEEKNDAFITVKPAKKDFGTLINLKSSVEKQYGTHIKNLISKILREKNYTDVIVDIIDKGAWDYTLIARLVTALERGNLK
ncbi:citrate lyase ACP [Pectinatus cerevisiiphilus]|uniref:Citrate lyase subunit gamma (Acyl carrier protein) n=1 Tax=Pectinatus cerevisiiphilus TaxID=86956 RepID=A0A4R3K635_9FIRM|nr:citrate lyase acyl carrier protein [Pectinatus cerevisiiphilus]TCS78220.1 citrate lyase subunit gamma (acyl carrier protein) [Pectinatus cerevisiiphilus]